MKRQTCCVCLRGTSDYLDWHPPYSTPSDPRTFHYCQERGCASQCPTPRTRGYVDLVGDEPGFGGL